MNDQTLATVRDTADSTRPAHRQVVGRANGQLVLSLMEAARLLGMGRTTAYRLARAGTFPCLVLRIGGRYAVPRHGLRILLGYDDSHDACEEGQEEARTARAG
ncbi:helix-turn-helix domain-containing protein [Nonomuraea sp. FMUSA5-5]|uniref:Helix-turn-helix domain-containing protein n=1 Tax=Nonomuraea composti TaxID=2720023 RepID=A0ABX1BEU1_9ACTN|nr:helix-turn-helix domain-containing protein [Nonomuraea sp. FMUSA5-5]